MKNSKAKSIITVAALAVLGIAILAGGAIVWWIHSPYFALQQIGTSISKHDGETFFKYCDAKTLVTTFTNELFLEPAMATQGMSQFQCMVAGGAIIMTKAKMDHALLTNIDRIFSPIPHTSFYHVFPRHLYWQDSRCQNVYSFQSPFRSLGPLDSLHSQSPFRSLGPLDSLHSQSPFRSLGPLDLSQNQFGRNTTFENTDQAPEQAQVKLVVQKLDLSDFAKNLGHELRSEQDDLKRLAAQRMQEYAASHQNQLIGRLISGPTRGVPFKSLLAEYGFQTSNIKTMYVHTDDDRQIATIEFFSPKVNANVPLSLELTPITPSEVFSEYKVMRIWKIKETMKKLGEDTDKQVQELIVCSLQDIAPEQAQNRTGNLLKRLGQHESTKKLLQQLKGKF